MYICMQLKRIDPTAVIYHYFERSASEFSLFDDELDMPVAYGSRNLVDATVRNLPPKVTVAYYKRDGADKISFKKKAFYEGKAVKVGKTLGNPPNAIPSQPQG